jgi:hypothetical protein
MKHFPTIAIWIAFLAAAACVTIPIWPSDILIGNNFLAGLSIWTVWFPAHAISNNYDLVQNSYALYPVETNILPLLTPFTSAIYYIFGLVLEPLVAFKVLFLVYLASSGASAFFFLKKQNVGLPFALIGGAVFAFNPVTFALFNRAEIALLGIFLLPLWFLAWDSYTAQPTFGRCLLVAVVTYAFVLMSLQYLNLWISALLPYALFSLPRQSKDTLIILALVVLFLCLLYPASPLIQSTYGERYLPLEVWQGVVNFSGWRWLLFAAAGVIGVLVTLGGSNLPLSQLRLWGLVFFANIVFWWRPDLSPLSILGSLFNVPDNPHLTSGTVFLFPAALAALVLTLRAAEPRFGQNRIAWVGLAVLAIGASGWEPHFDTTEVVHYAFLENLKNDPENYVVVTFPTGLDSLARLSTDDDELYPSFFFKETAGRAQAYMPYHHKRVFGGLAPSISAEQVEIYNASPLMRLLSFQPLDEPLNETIAALRWEVFRQRIGYILFHGGEVTPEFADPLRGWLKWTDTFCLVESEGDVEYWRARWHPAGCPPYQIEIGGADGILAAGEGWYAPEWTGSSMARWSIGDVPAELTAWINPGASDFQLDILAAGLAVGAQEVEVVANGESLGTFEMTEELETHSLALPRGLVPADGRVQLEFIHSTSEVIEGRQLAALYQTITISPESQ